LKNKIKILRKMIQDISNDEFDLLSNLTVKSFISTSSIIEEDTVDEWYSYINIESSTIPLIHELEKIIFKIYNDIYHQIYDREQDNIKIIIIDLNLHFQTKGVSFQKFPNSIDINSIYLMLKLKYDTINDLCKRNINKQIKEEIVEELSLNIESEFLKMLYLTSPTQSLTDIDYWNIKTNIINELNNLFIEYDSISL
jgi:hypothetical protein